MKRRDFIRTSSAVLAATWAQGIAAQGIAAPVTRMPVRPATGSRTADVVIRLTAKRRRVRIFSGQRTDVWSYTARLLQGPAATVQKIPRSYLAPVLRLRQGQRVRIEFRNRLAEESTVHWHGLHVPEEADGHPKDAVAAGANRDYEFDVLNRAGTYWFHPHPHGRTAEQVYYGLAGLFIVHDDEEQALGLPAGDRDLPLVIQDRLFDRSNQFVYRSGFGGGGPGGMMGGGMMGGDILVNGRADATIRVTGEPYRLRLLNGSNSRIYKLAWTDGTPLQVIGTDGGLLERPAQRDYVTLSPGERVELWVDFRDWSVGELPVLTSRAFESGMSGVGMPGGNAMQQGEAFDVATFRITGPGPGRETLPRRLSRIAELNPATADNAGAPREFEFAGEPFGGGAAFWTINGRTFELEQVAADERVAAGAMEIWEFSNPATGGGGPGGGPGGGMMGMRMPHPVHVHGSSFQVIERSVDSRGSFHDDWMTVSDGYVDEGWKDTVLLMPGETVRVIRRFDDFEGMYLIHCHNLEHEDSGMMRNFLVE